MNLFHERQTQAAVLDDDIEHKINCTALISKQVRHGHGIPIRRARATSADYGGIG